MSAPGDIRTNNFDLLRLVAAIQVVVEHGVEYLLPAGQQPWWDWILQALPGVPIFFALSGFLISLAFERTADVRVYAQNRLLRIYPGLWLCFLVAVVSVVVIGGVDLLAVGVPRLGLWVLAQTTIVQFYNPSWLRGYGVGALNGALWSIPVELQFYALLPLIYWALGLRRGRRNGPLLILFAVAWGIGIAYGMIRHSFGEALWFRLLGVTFVPYIYLFLGGVLIQRNWDRVGRWLAGRGLWWTAAYAVVAWAVHGSGHQVGSNWPNPFALPFLIGMVFALAYSVPTLADRLLRRNDLSYGVYIYHMLVLNAFLAFGWRDRLALVLPVLLVALSFAAFSWVFVERRALRFKRQTVHAARLSPS